MRSHLGSRIATLWLAVAPLAAVAQAVPQADAEPAAPPQAPPPANPPAPKAGPAFTIAPYGFVHFAYYKSLGPFSTKDYPGQALATSDGGADLASARSSRVGLRLGLGDDVWGARVSGLMEADFKGGYVPTAFTTTTATTCTGTPQRCTSTSTTSAAAASTAWSSPLFRIRHAFVKASWKTGVGEVGLVAGQDWALLAPLAPTTVVFASDQLFTAAGNLNRRAPQIKVGYEGSGALALNLALAALSPSDAGTPVDFGNGNRSRRPDLEGRLGMTAKHDGKKLVDVGASGHVNTRRYLAGNSDNDVTEWAVAADVQFNLPYLTLQGEAYTGKAIDDTFAGIAPSVNSALNNAAVRSGAVWGQAILKPVALCDLTFGYAVAQPKVSDLAGVTARTKNTMYGGGLIVNAHKAWKIGLEAYKTVSWTQDARNVATRAEAVQLALGTRLEF